jgi:hypothetical protein
LVIFAAAFLPLDLGGRGHPQHHDVLAQRRHGLGIPGHIEVAANDREIDLAVGQRLRARGAAIGLNRAKADVAVALGKGLGQRLDDLEIIAAGGADRDPQAHRPHLEIIGACECANDSEDPRQGDEHHPALGGTGRRRPLRPDQVGAFGHGSAKQSFEVQIHIANSYCQYVQACLVAHL